MFSRGAAFCPIPWRLSPAKNVDDHTMSAGGEWNRSAMIPPLFPTFSSLGDSLPPPFFYPLIFRLFPVVLVRFRAAAFAPLIRATSLQSPQNSLFTEMPAEGLEPTHPCG